MRENEVLQRKTHNRVSILAKTIVRPRNSFLTAEWWCTFTSTQPSFTLGSVNEYQLRMNAGVLAGITVRFLENACHTWAP